jgi:hypothetical protein
MTRFRIRAKDFKKFLNTISCKGTLQFKSKGKTEANLFSSFFIDVDKDNQKLTVLTVDTFFNQIKQVSTIGANVLEEGVIEITEKKAFNTILSSMTPESIVEIYSDGTSIYLENSEGDWYKRRIVGDKALDAVFDKKDKLFEWNQAHTLEEIVNEEAKAVKVWRFTVEQGTTIYPMRIKTTKKQLGKFVQDAVKLTRDNDTIIISENQEIEVWSGKPNSTNQSKHVLKFEDIGKTLIDFKVKFSALQAIVPNLLDDVILNFRKTGEQTIIMRIESFDKNMHQIISLGSQDKDGVLYESEEIPE